MDLLRRLALHRRLHEREVEVRHPDLHPEGAQEGQAQREQAPGRGGGVRVSKVYESRPAAQAHAHQAETPGL